MKLLSVSLASSLCFSCVSAQYEPKNTDSAKWVYQGRNRQLAVGDRRASVGPLSSDYALLLDGEAQTVAQDSHSSRVWGVVSGLTGAGASIAWLVVAPNLNDPFDTESTKGQIATGLFVSSLVLGALGGYFNASADVQLNDAINMHNDNAWSLKRPSDADAAPGSLDGASASEPGAAATEGTAETADEPPAASARDLSESDGGRPETSGPDTPIQR